MRENTVEANICRQVKALGGVAWRDRSLAEPHIQKKPGRVVVEDKLLGVGLILIRLIFHPAKETWTTELAKWDNLEGLTYSMIVGTPQERVDALNANADFYIVNRENVVWLVDYYKKRWPFEMVVIDELSSFKSSKALLPAGAGQ